MRASDSIMICDNCISLARRIPFSRAMISVSMLEKWLGRGLQSVAIVSHLLFLMITPMLDILPSSEAASSSLILYTPRGGASHLIVS